LLTVDRAPEFVIQPEDTNVNIINGRENVTIECAALPADDYTWERRDGTVPNKTIIIVNEEKSMLVIPNIRREDAGQYRCVTDGRGSRYARVTVTGVLV